MRLTFQALFCSETCLQEGNNSFHKAICPISACIRTYNIDLYNLLVLRIVTSLGLNQLKEKVAKYETENVRDLSQLGFNENGQYCSSDYRTVYHLETNLKKRDIKHTLKYAYNAVFTVLMLLKTSFFGSNIDVHCSSTKEDIILTGSVILRHILSFNCNAHGVQECRNNQINVIGAGAFGVCSLLNHSCDPAVSASFYGKRVVVFAIRSIYKGEELTDSYGYLFCNQPLAQRRMKLLSIYYFECSCKACSNHWPQYSSLNVDPYVFCPFCKKHVNIHEHQCRDHKVQYIFEDISRKIDEFSFAYEKLNFMKIDAKTDSLALEIISRLGKLDVLPCQLFVNCQEIVQRRRIFHDNQ